MRNFDLGATKNVFAQPGWVLTFKSADVAARAAGRLRSRNDQQHFLEQGSAVTVDGADVGITWKNEVKGKSASDYLYNKCNADFGATGLFQPWNFRVASHASEGAELHKTHSALSLGTRTTIGLHFNLIFCFLLSKLRNGRANRNAHYCHGPVFVPQATGIFI